MTVRDLEDSAHSRSARPLMFALPPSLLIPSAPTHRPIRPLTSLLGEDTLPTHGYLSIAAEFDNGQDITYFWSAEFPVGLGFRCPISTWTARETHVVIRYGAEWLGANGAPRNATFTATTASTSAGRAGTHRAGLADRSQLFPGLGRPLPLRRYRPGIGRWGCAGGESRIYEYHSRHVGGRAILPT